MSAIIMDGKALAQRIKVDIAAAIGKLDKPVGLGTILVGDDPGSVAYVEGKKSKSTGTFNGITSNTIFDGEAILGKV